MSNLAVITVAVEVGRLEDELNAEANARVELTNQLNEIYNEAKHHFDRLGLDCKMISMQFIKQSNVFVPRGGVPVTLLEGVAVMESKGDGLQSLLDDTRATLGYKRLADHVK